MLRATCTACRAQPVCQSTCALEVDTTTEAILNRSVAVRTPLEHAPPNLQLVDTLVAMWKVGARLLVRDWAAMNAIWVAVAGLIYPRTWIGSTLVCEICVRIYVHVSLRTSSGLQVVWACLYGMAVRTRMCLLCLAAPLAVQLT